MQKSAMRMRFFQSVNSGKVINMKPEYTEGPEAFDNFERFAKQILQAPKPKQKAKKKRPKQAALKSRPKRDKG